MNDRRLENLRLLIEKHGTQANLVKTYDGLDASYICTLLKGRRSFGEKAARNMESKCGLPDKWFDENHDERQLDNNVSPVSPPSGSVPLISWVNAGDWESAIDNMGTYERVTCPFTHSGDTFALQVRGISMYNPDGDVSFSDGDIIFVDPNRQAVSGDYIIAMHDMNHEATFKRYHVEDGRQFLVALNPDWKPKIQEIKETTFICGVVVGSQVNKKFY